MKKVEADSADRFLKQAIAATGLDDFGDDNVLTPLRILAEDLNDPDMPNATAERLRGIIARNLAQRLRLLDVRKRHPEVAQEEVIRPLFVIGLPRTGTTALVDMLAQDPAARFVMQWEAANLPDVLDPASWATDPRIDALEEQFRQMPAEFTAMGLHTYGARLPDECNSFMTLSLQGPNLSVIGHFPRYTEWLRLSRMPRPYAFHRCVLQHLQHFGVRGNWVLKSPWHGSDLPGLLEAYPDAVFVQTHRDPVPLTQSNAGLYSVIRGEKPGHPRRSETGREVMELYGTVVQRLMAARMDPAVDARVLDLSHQQMIDDPVSTVRLVYERFGMAFTPQFATLLHQWAAAPAQQMSPVKFTLEEFGLDATAVNQAFGPYRARFAHLF